jgi:hypothetical protein
MVRRISRVAVLGAMACALMVGGSALAVAKGHRHASVADVIKDVKDAKKDSTDATKDTVAAKSDVTAPDSPAVAQQEQADAQNEQTDNRSEGQEGKQEGDSPGQAIACQGLLTDNVQYDEQTGTCTAETGQENGTGGQDTGTTTGGQDNTSTSGGQSNNQSGA